MNLIQQRAVSGLSAQAQATNPGVSWNEPLGRGPTRVNLPGATAGYEIAGQLGVGEDFVLDVRTNKGFLARATADMFAVPQTAELGFDNGSIFISSTDLTLETVEVVIDLVNRVSFAAQKVGGVLRVTSGDCATILLEADPGDPGNVPASGNVGFPGGMVNGKASFSDLGDYSVSWDGTKWVLISESGGSYESSEDVATPDLVGAWTAIAPATGTPIITGRTASISMIEDALNSLDGIEAEISFSHVITDVVYEQSPPLVGGSPGYSGSYIGQRARVGAEAPYAWYEWDGEAWVVDASSNGTNGLDFEGNRLATMAVVHGIEFICDAGGLEIIGSEVAVPLSAGGAVQVACPVGYNWTSVTITGTAAGSRFRVTVLGA